MHHRKYSRIECLFGVAISMLVSCTSSPTPRLPAAIDARDALIAAIAGVWDNHTQFASVPAALKMPPSVNGEWLDLQHARFAVVDAPAIGSHVLYLEWRNGGPEGAISRQRIWSFRMDAAGIIHMDFFAFVDGKPWAGRANNADAFRALSVDVLRGYGAACGLVFNTDGARFRGVISASQCNITAASGRRMSINAKVELGADGTLEYRESGQLEDGRYAFRVPTSQPYRFVRIL